MRRTWPIWVAIASTTSLCLIELHSLNASVGVLIHSRMVDTQTATSRWRETDGISLSLSTYRDPVETDEEFVRRHQTAVEAMARRIGDSARSEHVEHR